MLSFDEFSYTILTLVVGAFIGCFIQALQEKKAWADTRNVTYDLIAGDLSAIGGAGLMAFLEIMKESSYSPSECFRNMHKTHPRYAKMRGKYGPEVARLGDAIRYSAWMTFDERHGSTPSSVSLFDMTYTETFYSHASKNINKLRSDMRVLISIPGDMKVKTACIDLEQAATLLSNEFDGYTRIQLNPPVQISLRFLGKAAALSEILKEITYKPRMIDRLNS